MNLTTPTDHASAYEWASVLLAHGFVGLALVALVAWLLDRIAGEWIDAVPVLAFWIVSGLYFAGWEGIVQGFGAGLTDALVDSFAVMAGGLIGLSAWARQGGGVAASLALTAIVLVGGIWRRR